MGNIAGSLAGARRARQRSCAGGGRSPGCLRALGGLGLQSAELTAPAAYWAAWADALPAIRDRLPGCAENYVVMLETDAEDAAHCLAEAARERRSLQAEGWSECPTWRVVLEGARPTPSTEDSAGDWRHGWQTHASRIHTEHYRDRVLMPAQLLSSQAMLRSQAGPREGAWLTAIACEPATTMPPQAMQIAFAATPTAAAPAQPHPRLPQNGPLGPMRQNGGASLGPRRPRRSRGPGRAATVAHLHNCPRRPCKRSPAPRSPCLRCHCSWGRPLL